MVRVWTGKEHALGMYKGTLMQGFRLGPLIFWKCTRYLYGATLGKDHASPQFIERVCGGCRMCQQHGPYFRNPRRWRAKIMVAFRPWWRHKLCLIASDFLSKHAGYPGISHRPGLPDSPLLRQVTLSSLVAAPPVFPSSACGGYQGLHPLGLRARMVPYRQY
jgi:hypothetical protein